MHLKFNIVSSIVIIIILFFFSSCSNEEKAAKDKESYEIKIDSLSQKKFYTGDTIRVYGKNFGAERHNKGIFIEGKSIEEEDYLEWSDSLITIKIPSGINTGNIYINSKLSNSVDFELDRPLYVVIIDSFVNLSLFITIIFLYLRINKIWKRKHEREVAESQSLAGLTIYILNCILWVSYYIFVEPDTKSLIDTSIYIFEGTIFFMIGTGLWVRGQKRMGLWVLIKQALRLERKEANYLIKRFFKPQNAEVIINILHQLAMIDEELDVKEQELITLFAKEWNIDYSIEKLNKERLKETENNYVRLRNSVIDYIEREPPVEQVAQLKDMMSELINADDKVTKEEELISTELMGLIENYLKKDKKPDVFHVIIVPQQPEHEKMIKELLPDASKVQTAGGTAYSIGSFYSRKYADMICRQFRKSQLFTIVYSYDEDEQKNNNLDL